MLKKLGLALLTLVVFLLMAEGALSLFAELSLRDAFRTRWPTDPTLSVPLPKPAVPSGQAVPPSASAPSGQAEEAPGANANPTVQRPDRNPEPPNMYVIDEDPRVSYSLRPSSEFAIYDTLAHSDEHGLRVYTGPPEQPGSPRVAVVGDSVAFGFGVADDQTLAAHLQEALATVRGPDQPPVVCRTVATPSWNHFSEAAFLLDHWDVVHPDVVVFVPCKNDLFDLDSLYENGRRRIVVDANSANPWLTVSMTVDMNVIGPRVAEKAGKTIAYREMGTYALDADLSPESAQRYDENANDIVRLRNAVAERGARMVVAWTNDSDYDWHLSTRLDALAPDLESVGFVDSLPDGGTLGYDPHPSPAALTVFGTWLAADLLDRGWVGRGANAPLPDVPPAYEEVHQPWPSPEDRARRAKTAREIALKLLQTEIDFHSGRGIKQVYGGLNRDLTARTRMLVLLGPGGDALQLELAPLEGRPDEYPLHVEVDVDGQRVGEVIVPAEGSIRAVLPLPSGRPDHPIEVALLPETTVLVPSQAHAHIASFLPVRIACRPR